MRSKDVDGVLIFVIFTRSKRMNFFGGGGAFGAYPSNAVDVCR